MHNSFKQDAPGQEETSPKGYTITVAIFRASAEGITFSGSNTLGLNAICGPHSQFSWTYTGLGFLQIISYTG